PDEPAAVMAARRYLSYFRPLSGTPAEHADQRVLRHLIPENRVRSYDVRPVIEALCDTGSVLELRAGFGVGVVTALARLGGHAVGLLVNNPRHLGGAARRGRRDGARGGGAARLPQGAGGDRGPRGARGALRGAGRRAVHPRQGGQHRDGVRDRRCDRPGGYPRCARWRASPRRQRRMTGRIRRLGYSGPCRTRLTATVTWPADSSAMTPPVLLLRS